MQCSRRHFLAGSVSTLAFPTLIPSGLIARTKGVIPPPRPAPSERINIGIIGYGTMAHDNLGNFLYHNRVQVTAVSDPNRGTTSLYGYNGKRGGGMEPCRRRVDTFYAKQKGKSDYKGCKTFADFRELLESDVDAVVISTPDHWHALNAIYAARKGKHVYCQKPMSLTIGQGKAMVRAARESGITFQVGSQQRSDTNFRRACEFVRNGYLGSIKEIHIGLPGGKFHSFGKDGKWCSKTPWKTPPDYFGNDGFEMWQGPAERRAFTPAIHAPMSWRFNLAYGGGEITDWGAHHLDIMQWALGKDGDGPIALENIRSDIDLKDPVWNVAGTYSFDVVYADGTRARVSNSYRNGLSFFGDNGKSLFVTRGRLTTHPPALYRTRLRPEDTKLYVSGQHERNFINCIISGKPTITPCDVGHRSITIAHIANIALRIGRKNLRWDPVNERFPDCEAANKLMDSPLHNGWVLDPGV